MKRYDPSRADQRSIEDKAFAMLYAMTDDQVLALRSALHRMDANKCRRAALILSGDE
jgi:hypothetical protein